MIPDLKLSDFRYDLPEARIAQHPVSPRDSSRLLQCREGRISHHRFRDLPEQLPAGSLLVFNDTKVIKARLFLRRETGALIEVLLMHPHAPAEVHQAMQASETAVWSCIIGNKKKWKADEVLTRAFHETETPFTLQLSWENREENLVRFRWDGDIPFASWLQSAGQLPLPPYLEREADEQDLVQYQTVYAKEIGAVAAPTAGLHFTDRVMDDLRAAEVQALFVTLHVSAGTFLPVKTEQVAEHDMHQEQMIVTRETVERLLAHEGPLVAVGTTSMRWLESLYWVGYDLLNGQPIPERQTLYVSKVRPYQEGVATLPPMATCLRAIQVWMTQRDLPQFIVETAIMIMPGYPFRTCDGLITNFHMPETTLMLLVAAFVGENWRRIYDAALAEGYRFLSYGDSSLLWRY